MNFIIKCLLISALIYETAAAQIVINELMPAPQNGPEWVELYNNSANSISISKAEFRDAKSTTSLPALEIDAGGYLILTKDPEEFTSAWPEVPEGIILEASLPALNNTTDEAVLYINAELADSLYYDMKNGKKGSSFERIDPARPAYEDGNLLTSIDAAGATPGAINSRTEPEYDIAADSIYIKAKIIYFRFVNTDKMIEGGAEAQVFTDIDGNGEFSENELIYENAIDFEEGVAEFSLHIDEFSGLPEYRLYPVLCTASHENDIKSGNNSLLDTFYLPRGYSAFINEIMYDPADPCPEYIEIINYSAKPVSFAGWSVHDEAALDEEGIVIDQANQIPPGAYFLIAMDESIYEAFPELMDSANVFIPDKSISLNNSGDIIIIRDPYGNTIDSLEYENSWHDDNLPDTKGLSLEKVLAGSVSGESYWSTSIAEKGGTPAGINSISIERPSSGKLVIEPNPFSPYSSGKEQFCVIRWEMPFARANITAYVFNLGGARVRELVNFELFSSTAEIVWDGRNDEGYPLQPGGYVLYMEAIDSASDKIEVIKEVIAIGK
ncbi:MAG: lamin tail domain-containing protein [Candidatus Kapaibacterium sp.]